MWEIWSKQHLNIHLWFIYILVDMIWLGRIICNYICTGMKDYVSMYGWLVCTVM
jgi:hypothetical protein